MKAIYTLSLSIALCACSHSPESTENESVCKYVDQRIGTGGHGHVFMGASVPFGMVQLGPTSIPQEWDWCSGYHESDSTIIGFSHTHLSGTGIGDLFDITVMPVVGDVTYARGDESDQASGLWSYGDRQQENYAPGYYRIPLTRYGIDAELTATARVGMHRYTFPQSDTSAIVIDLKNGGCWDRVTDAAFNIENDHRISGYRYSRGWAADQKVYFVAEFSKPMKGYSLHGDNNEFARINFDTDSAEQILMKVAISPVSIEGAARNLAAEAPNWDFDAVRENAYKEWEKELGKVKIKSYDQATLTKFYTALYHTMISPVIFNDVDGQYRGADGEIYNAQGFTPYTIMSLWDTYRTALPLMSITNPERYADIINSMLDICDNQGVLPVWHLWGNETNCMVGNPGIIAVADAVAKGTKGVDGQRAMKAMLATAADTCRGGGYRAKYGFIPCDFMNEGIAFDMEYAIADGALANAARTLGMKEIADSFDVRSKSYKHYFDPSINFMRGKLSDGSWRTPFDPIICAHRADDFCEGNSWQYTWLVPHDVEGLKECFGSREAMVTKLDSLFTADSTLGKDASPDISGLIGQYAHGNEPGHHILYLYAMLGEPEKGADLIRKVLDEMYTTNADGLAGNEDTGQMSAWYIMSALGFYPVAPGSNQYWFGSPIITEAQIEVPGGTFEIVVNNNSDKNKHIDTITLNGKQYELPYITHDEIMKGGKLVINMKE